MNLEYTYIHVPTVYYTYTYIIHKYVGTVLYNFYR